MNKFKVTYYSCQLFSNGYQLKETLLDIPDNIDNLQSYVFGELMSLTKTTANNIISIEKI